MLRPMYLFLALALSLPCVSGARTLRGKKARQVTELLRNPGFEEPLTGEDWSCSGQGVVERSTDAYAGSFSGKVTGRTQVWNGLVQSFPMEPNSQYRFRAYLKVLTLLDGYLWHDVTLYFNLEFRDRTTQMEQIGLLPYTRPDWGWEEIGADFIMDDRDVVAAELTIRFRESADIEFLLDEATVTKVETDPDWRDKADQRINQLRKGDVTVQYPLLLGGQTANSHAKEIGVSTLDIRGSCEPERVSVKMNHFRHEFPFGSAVRAHIISPEGEESDANYQRTFFDNFNWGVTANSMKWKGMEKQRGVIDFEKTEKALDAFDANDVPARGHCLFWGKLDNNPDWLHNGYEGDDMKAELARRIDYMTRFNGRLRHYDVNNEFCHGDWYEQKTGDHELTDWMFEEVNRVDPDTELFLNDFAVVRGSSRTLCYTNVAKRMVAAGVPLRGLGIQSHMKDYPDIALYQDRLATVASAGLPIWITELDYADEDVEVRADALEDALRLYFSTEAVEGIILWHFGNESTGGGEPHKTLFDGPDYTPNAAGVRWQHLMRTEWSTWRSLDPSSPSEDFSFRAFYGNYTVKVNYDDELMERSHFFVGKGLNNHLDLVIDNC